MEQSCSLGRREAGVQRALVRILRRTLHGCRDASVTAVWAAEKHAIATAGRRSVSYCNSKYPR
jgi:hypothetical protein